MTPPPVTPILHTLSINGEPRVFVGDPMTPLSTVLRDHLGLTGTKEVCGEGFCGACTVQIDGAAVPACLRPVGLLEGAEITTIEGVGEDSAAARVQAAFLDHDVVQCGMCFPGMVMCLGPLLSRNAPLSRDDIKAALTGNACRCTGYERLIDALMSIAPSATPGPEVSA